MGDQTKVRSPGSRANQIPITNNRLSVSAGVNPKANVPFSETHVWALLANNCEPKPIWAEMQPLKQHRHRARTTQLQGKMEAALAMASSYICMEVWYWLYFSERAKLTKWYGLVLYMGTIAGECSVLFEEERHRKLNTW